MEYLNKVLGIEVVYMNGKFEHLPNFIVTRYRLQRVSMNGQGVIFLYPKTELEQVEVLKKQYILVTPLVSSRQKIFQRKI